MKNLITLLLLFFAITTIAQTTSNTTTPLIKLGWESGTRTQGMLGTASWCEPSHDGVLSTAYARTGTTSLRFQINDTDANCTGHMRTETYSRNIKLMGYNNTISWSELIPTNMAYDIIPEVHFQMHDSGSLGSPLWAIEVWQDRYYFGTTTYDEVTGTCVQKKWDLGPVSKGMWVDWVVVQKFRLDASGNFKVYKNGVLATGGIRQSNGSYSTTFTPMDINGANFNRLADGRKDGVPYPKFGIYKWQWTPKTGYPTGTPHTVTSKVVYIDDVKFGDSTLPLSQFFYTTPLASTITKTSVNCSGGNDGTATIDVSGGTAPYSYTWSTSPVQYAKTATGLAAGTYTVTAKDAAGNTTSASVTITQPSAVSITASAVPILVYGDSTAVTLGATGGTAPYTFTGATSVVAGTYMYTAKDAKGCSSTTTLTIIQPTVLTTSAAASSIKCFGGSATVTVSASGGVGPYTGTGAFSVTAGTYSYLVKDKNGAISIATIAVTQPALVNAATVSAVKHPTCAMPAGSVELNNLPAAGTWKLTRLPDSSNTSGTGKSVTITGLTPGKTYAYIVADTAGCASAPTQAIAIDTVLAPDAPVVVSITQPTCNVTTGTVVLNNLPAVGQWTLTGTAGIPSITGTGTTQTVTGLPAGTVYTFTVTSDAGCTSFPSAEVVLNKAPVNVAAPIVSSITQPSCTVTTGSVVLTGLPSSGTWTLTRMPGNYVSTISGTSKTISGLVAGTTYTYTLNSSDGCSSAPSANIVINASPKPTLKALGLTTGNTLNSCGALVTLGNNLTITGSPVPVITYKIGTTAITSPYTFPAGTSTVTATASNSCGSVSANFTVVVSDNQLPMISSAASFTKTASSNTYTVLGKEFDATASDNCGIASLYYGLSGATILASSTNNKTLNAVRLNKGTTTITWTAIDVNGKKSTSMVTVTVTNVKNTVKKVAAAGTSITTSSLMETKAVTGLNAGSVKDVITGNVADKKEKPVEAASTNVAPALAAQAMPNPSSGEFMLQLKSTNNHPVNIVVKDAAGRTIEQKNNIEANSSLSLGARYISGIYFAVILQDRERFIVRLVKQ